MFSQNMLGQLFLFVEDSSALVTGQRTESVLVLHKLSNVMEAHVAHTTNEHIHGSVQPHTAPNDCNEGHYPGRQAHRLKMHPFFFSCTTERYALQ